MRTIRSETVVALLLWINAAIFVLGVIAGLSFQGWIVLDVVAVILCGLVGWSKKILLLKIAAGITVIGFLFRFNLLVWILIDLFVIGSCGYVGFLLWKGRIDGMKS